MATINMHDAKTQLSDLVARAEAGEEIVIARRNKPVVRLVKLRVLGEPLPPVERELSEHRPDDERIGFSESEQADYDAGELRRAVEAGKEFTIMRGGKPVAKVVPLEKTPRVPGRFAPLRDSLPPDLFDQPLDDVELAAWEGRHSGVPDPDPGSGDR